MLTIRIHDEFIIHPCKFPRRAYPRGYSQCWNILARIAKKHPTFIFWLYDPMTVSC